MAVDSIEQKILESIRELPTDKQMEVLSFVESLKSKQEFSIAEEDTSYASPPIAIEEISSQIEQPFDSENKKGKERTIAQAILEVMNEVNRPMTSREICSLILEKQLYRFNTNDPLKMVRDALWRHDEKTGKRSSPNKYFVQNGKYWIPSDDVKSITPDNEEIVMIDIEASIYDYLFDLEDLQRN